MNRTWVSYGYQEDSGGKISSLGQFYLALSTYSVSGVTWQKLQEVRFSVQEFGGVKFPYSVQHKWHTGQKHINYYFIRSSDFSNLNKGIYLHLHVSTYSHLVGKEPAARGEGISCVFLIQSMYSNRLLTKLKSIKQIFQEELYISTPVLTNTKVAEAYRKPRIINNNNLQQYRQEYRCVTLRL